MFNALTSTQLLVGVGRVLRMVADAKGELEGFQRSQALSAFSVTRLLASEQLAAADLLDRTRADLGEALADDDRPPAIEAKRRVDNARDGLAIGDAIGDLLAALPRPDALRTRVHAILRDMTDREVAALAQPPA
ncbi:MAG: hypothetical protein V7607_1311 [Solirubrobacteraceae bacterium]